MSLRRTLVLAAAAALLASMPDLAAVGVESYEPLPIEVWRAPRIGAEWVYSPTRHVAVVRWGDQGASPDRPGKLLVCSEKQEYG